MHLTPLDLAIFIAYMLAVLVVGLYAARRGNRTKRDYFLAGDKLPWWMVGGSIVAANISSQHLVGSMGTAYYRGFVAMVTEWGAILIGFNALLWIFLPFYLRNGFYTVPEYLFRRFGPSVRITYALLILFTYLFVEIGAVLYLGALALFSLLGIPIIYSIVVLAVVTGLYTIAGGLRAVVWTEMLQLGVLLLGGIALSIATLHATGLNNFLATSKDWHVLLPASDPDFPWTMYLGGSLCISIFYCAANQFIVQRALAAKDEWHARMGIVFTDYLKFLLPLIIIVPGLMARTLFPHLARADLAFPTLVENLLPVGLVGLVMAGLIAAVMGHISGAVNSVTTIATMDFFVPAMRWRAMKHEIRNTKSETNPNSQKEQIQNDRWFSNLNFDHLKLFRISFLGFRASEDTQALRFGRLFGVIALIIGIICAELLVEHSHKPIFLYLLDAYGYFTPGIAAMFLLGIFWPRTTTTGALAAGFLTIPLSVALEWYFPHLAFQNRTGIVFWVCMIACALVSLCTAPEAKEKLKGLIWTKQSLQLPPDQRQKYRGLRRPVIWWAVITVIVLFFYIRFA